MLHVNLRIDGYPAIQQQQFSMYGTFRVSINGDVPTSSISFLDFHQWVFTSIYIYICIYIYMYIYIYYTDIYIYTYVFTFTHTYTYCIFLHSTYIYIQMYSYIYIYIIHSDIWMIHLSHHSGNESDTAERECATPGAAALRWRRDAETLRPRRMTMNKI